MGIVLVSPEKLVVEKSLRLVFLATNNEAEYKALLAGMAMVGRLGGLYLVLNTCITLFDRKDYKVLRERHK